MQHPVIWTILANGLSSWGNCNCNSWLPAHKFSSLIILILKEASMDSDLYGLLHCHWNISDPSGKTIKVCKHYFWTVSYHPNYEFILGYSDPESFCGIKCTTKVGGSWISDKTNTESNLIINLDDKWRYLSLSPMSTVFTSPLDIFHATQGKITSSYIFLGTENVIG